MNRFFLIICMSAVLGTLDSVAQEIDYNTIILSGNASNLSVEERLVQLAWRNNPGNDRIELQAESQRLELKISQWNWLDIVTLRSNINEFVLNPEKDVLGRAQFYPKYNISFILPLSFLSSTPLTVKRNRVQLAMAEDQIKLQKLSVRAEILTLYTKYLLAKERLKVQRDAEQDSYAGVQLVEDNFKRGLENVQSYNNILERYTNHRLLSIAAEAEVKLLKIEIEQIVGVKLETIISN